MYRLFLPFLFVRFYSTLRSDCTENSRQLRSCAFSKARDKSNKSRAYIGSISRGCSLRSFVWAPDSWSSDSVWNERQARGSWPTTLRFERSSFDTTLRALSRLSSETTHATTRTRPARVLPAGIPNKSNVHFRSRPTTSSRQAVVQTYASFHRRRRRPRS